MSDASINAGKYLGSGLGSFDVEANKTAAKGKQKASDAVNTAKNTMGADITVFDASGNATVHSVKIDNGVFTKPKPTSSGFLTIENLTSPNGKIDKTKPLAIDPTIAGKLGGTVALFVDEKNNTTVINGDKKTVASNFLDDATASKVDAAYTIAGDDNFVNKKMASNVVADLNANYRNTDNTSKEIALMKDGQVKTGMNALISELKTISANTSELETQSKQRTQKFNTDIAKPQDRLNKANAAWDNANKIEDQKINIASENLREAKFPGVHEKEDQVGEAQQMVSDGKGYLQNAVNKVSEATNEVNKLENLKTKTQGIVEQNKNLEFSNKEIVRDMGNYIVNRKTQLESIKASLNDKASYFDNLAAAESRKPAAPSGGTPSNGGTSSDPFSGNKPTSGSGSTSGDPFSGGGNGSKPTGGSTSGDPFSGGSGGNKPTGGSGSTSGDPFSGGGNGSKPTGSSTSSDPFSTNGQYRNDNAVSEYRRRASDIRADASNIDMRIKGLNQVIDQARYGGIESSGFRNAINRLSDNYNYNGYGYVFNEKDDSYNYFKADKSDRGIINRNFIEPYDDNNSQIRQNNAEINKNVAYYKNNIDGANQKLTDAKVAESQASGNLQGAQARLTQLNAELNTINSKPALTEANPNVKKAKTSLDNAIKNKDNTVGANAALTKEKNSAQGAVDSITDSHDKDIKELNSKIASNANQAQQKINETKRNLGL